MKRSKTLLMVWAMVAVAMPSVADVKDTQDTSSEARSPHRELREAVAKIRSYYSPGSNANAAYRIAGAARYARLGVIVGGSLWSDEDWEGALVVAVTPGSPADAAGLAAGDVITRFNDESLVDDHDDTVVASMKAAQRLVELARELEDGDRVTLEYARDGSTHRVELVAREHEFDPMTVDRLRELKLGKSGHPFVWTAPVPARWFVPRAWLDMELVALNPELGEYFGADSGVLVVRGPHGDDALGLKSGDVILRIGEREVRNPEHAMRILRSYEPEEELTLVIVRRGRSQTLTGKVPKSPIEFDFDFGGWQGPVDR